MISAKWPLCLSHALRSVKVAGQLVPKNGALSHLPLVRVAQTASHRSLPYCESYSPTACYQCSLELGIRSAKYNPQRKKQEWRCLKWHLFVGVHAGIFGIRLAVSRRFKMR